ncbi:MAG: KEOPS complex kinase/ATPase Bud32 [archaeon]|jgi:Kae1-associated kinase Bud32
MVNQIKFTKKGAEAELTVQIIDGERVLLKKRIPKGYRNKTLDAQIRKKRTRGETKLLREVSVVVNVPKIIRVDENLTEIVMEYIAGVELKEVLEKNPLLCIEVGEKIRKIHDRGIIHGDLTTSNILFVEKTKNKDLLERITKKGPLFFIDFGLGFFSDNIEDKATDLVVFKKTFNATHSGLSGGWEKVMKGYNPDSSFIERMRTIEKRARYH